ncbi:hypothetical protein TSAR_006600 [Trichomalopsis sarcophagae]|uniref:DUF4806 domain-containing protein n=1 Tax=Trichomalopsis sarcophagae TaxID=543379 RepID=A0A232EQG9_9HYME|nr:hypothetical protein TSAR_006600 [Trichomalopsis sarcophagae]
MARKKTSGKKELPKFLPFKTVAELFAFQEISQEDYNDVVDYLEYLGGYNASDAAAIYLKQCFQPTADLVEKVTWLGSRKNGISALKDTRFVQACEATLKRMARKKISGKKELPKFLPFKTVAELLAFHEISQEDYNDVVDYLEYLGGYNASDAAAIYLKQCFQPTADLVEKVTWLGSRKNGISSLKDTRFVEACEEAMAENKKFGEPAKTDLATAMTKALKCVKEEYCCRKSKRAAGIPLQNGLPLQRRRVEEDKNNGIDDGDELGDDDEPGGGEVGDGGLGNGEVEDGEVGDVRGQCFQPTADLVEKVTWLGSRKNGIRALKDTRFVQACEEAMTQNKRFGEPSKTDIATAMTKALKCIKEEYRRRKAKRAAGIPLENGPSVQRRRVEEAKNNGIDDGDELGDDEPGGGQVGDGGLGNGEFEDGEVGDVRELANDEFGDELVNGYGEFSNGDFGGDGNDTEELMGVGGQYNDGEYGDDAGEGEYGDDDDESDRTALVSDHDEERSNDPDNAAIFEYLFLNKCGYNASDAAAIYLKQCFQPTADLVEKVTWLGSRKNGISSLKDTRFVEACEEAMAENKKFGEPAKTDLATAMTKALKCVKEEYCCRKSKRAAGIPLQNGLPLQRRRVEEDKNNGIDDGDELGDDDEPGGGEVGDGGLGNGEVEDGEVGDVRGLGNDGEVGGGSFTDGYGELSDGDFGGDGNNIGGDDNDIIGDGNDTEELSVGGQKDDENEYGDDAGQGEYGDDDEERPHCPYQRSRRGTQQRS